MIGGPHDQPRNERLNYALVHGDVTIGVGSLWKMPGVCWWL